MAKKTFFNHLGSSVIDYVLADQIMFYNDFDCKVLDFNEWSDHAPIEINIKGLNMSKSNSGDVINNKTHNTHVFKWCAEKCQLMRAELEDKKDILQSTVDDMVANVGNIDNYVKTF